MALPLWVRKFILDAVETGLAALFAMALVFPTSLEEGKAFAAAVGVALLGAIISAARRAIPGFLAWLRGILAVPDEGNG